MSASHSHDHPHPHGHDHDREHGHGHPHPHDHHHDSDPGHDHPHPHAHEHGHGHGRAPGGFLRVALPSRRAVWAWAAVAALVYACSGIRMVGPAERGIVRRFGRVVNDNVRSGFHFGLPAGVETLTRVRMRKAHRVGVGIAVTDRLTGVLPDPGVSQFLSGDRNIVDIQLSVQYMISDPTLYLFGTVDPDEAVRKACESALCEIVAGMSVDRILTLGRAEIQLRVATAAQEMLERHGAGVRITSVTQEKSAPPERVADAFRGVTGARADRDRLVAEAEGYREDLLPRARGEAAALLQQAEADAYDSVNLARGHADRLAAIRDAAGSDPDLTRRRLHAEALEEVLGRTRKVIVDPRGETDVRFVEEGP